MEIIYLLIPLSIVLVAMIIGAFLWSVRSGQFDDLNGPAYRILMDDDTPVRTTQAPTPSARPPDRPVQIVPHNPGTHQGDTGQATLVTVHPPDQEPPLKEPGSSGSGTSKR